jgi:hypothetical protein
LPFGAAEGTAAAMIGRAENRSGVVSAGRRDGMPPTMPPVVHHDNNWQAMCVMPKRRRAAIAVARHAPNRVR